MDSGWYLFVPAIAASTYAAKLVGGKSAYLIPVTIAALASSPSGQAALADKWEVAYKQLGDASQQLTKTKDSKYPHEWTAADRTAFDGRVKVLQDQLEKSRAIVSGTGQTIRQSALASWISLLFCTTAATIMVTAAMAANAASVTGPAGAVAGRLAAMRVADKVLIPLNNIMKKKRVLASAAALILAGGTTWHLVQGLDLRGQIDPPTKEKPDFTQVSLTWK